MTRRSLFLLMCAFLLAGCLRTTEDTPTSGYLPPTVVPPPTSTPAPPTPQPVRQDGCTDVLSFIDDITILDGSVVKPGAELDKRWQVRNNGTCDWTEAYTLRLTSGDPLGSEKSQALYPARSGSAAVIQLLLTAPELPGNYRSSWQAYNAKGDAFGDPVYIDIVVE
ncbi:MAG: hypothetical protein C0391_08580 [Anaerolinea sp.]|nr:hypothetical protein [Anaerolinea sp.]